MKGQKDYKMSLETRKKLSESHKGYKYSLEARKNMSESHKGQKLELIHKSDCSCSFCKQRRHEPLSIETRKKLSEARHLVLTEEFKKKISLALKGRRTWDNRGISLSLFHKEDCPCSFCKQKRGDPLSEETRNKLKRRVPWNKGKKGMQQGWSKGLTKKTSPSVKSISEGLKNYWQHLTPEQKRKYFGARISEPQKELFELVKLIFPDAELEYLVKTQNGYRYADIGIPSQKLDFEYDGEFAHKRMLGKDYDRSRDLELAEVGWVTFRVDKDVLKKVREVGVKSIMLKEVD